MYKILVNYGMRYKTDIASEGSYVKEEEVTLIKTNGRKHETVSISNQR